MDKIILIDCDTISHQLFMSSLNKVNSSIELIIVDTLIKALQISKVKQVKGFFIDTKLIGYKEISLVKELNRESKCYEIPLIFIGSKHNREIDVFMKIHSYHYIEAPFNEGKLENLLRRILNNKVNNGIREKEFKISLEFRDYTLLIEEREIIFIEYKNRKIVVKTTEKFINYKHMPLKAFKTKLSSDFMQIHQSIIINKVFIESYQKNTQSLRLKGIDYQLPIGRSYKQEVCRSLTDI